MLSTKQARVSGMRRGHPQGSSGPSPPSPSHPPHRYSSPVVPSALVMLPGPCTHQATLSALTRTGLCLHIGHHLCVRRNGCCLRRRLEAGGRVLSLRQQPCRLGVTCCCGRCNHDAQAAGQGDRGGFGWRGQRRGAHKLQRGRGRTQVRERRVREESPTSSCTVTLMSSCRATPARESEHAVACMAAGRPSQLLSPGAASGAPTTWRQPRAARMST